MVRAMFRYICNLYLYKVTEGTGSGDSAFTRTLEERYEFYVSIIIYYLLLQFVTAILVAAGSCSHKLSGRAHA
jgi:hypothetical protein